MRYLLRILIASAIGLVGCDGSNGVAESGWFRQDIGPINPLLGVSFVDENIGTAVGFSTILRTTDGGLTWTEQYRGDEFVRLVDVSFTDANNGTAVGDSSGYGAILRTTDGGQTWAEQDLGNVPALFGVSFVDANSGTAVGSFGTVLRTTNGGQSWILQDSGTEADLLGVSFTDANTGTAVGTSFSDGLVRPVILRTTNGGATWAEQDTGLGDAEGSLMGVWFTDERIGTATGASGDRALILRTIDGGTTWVQQSAPTTATGRHSLARVCFTDANHGTTVGTSETGGLILRTRDGGATWIKQDSGPSPALFGVSFSDASNGAAVGITVILRTIGGGWGPFIETAPYCADKPDDTECSMLSGGGTCLNGLCCRSVDQEIICDEPGGGGTGGSGGTGGTGGGGVGGDGGTGGQQGACINDEDTQTYASLTYTTGDGVEETGHEAASAIASECVFGTPSSVPANPGCPNQAQAVLLCSTMGCPPEDVEALSVCVVGCTQDIIEQSTGATLSEQCASCYGDVAACTLALCATSGCTNPTSQSCIQCRCDNDCTPGFDICSGLPPSGECG